MNAYSYLTDEPVQETAVVGGFSNKKDQDFIKGLEYMLESFQAANSVDIVNNIAMVLTTEAFREDFKERLLGDVMESSAFTGDEYSSLHINKLEQLFENTAYEIIRESTVSQLSPIVGLTLPILKKEYLKCHSKDIVVTEVPEKPIIKVAFERKFLKDRKGNKYYFPDIFYNEKYKEVLPKTKGKPIADTWFPEGVDKKLPFQDLNILELSGGSLETRDTLAANFCIQAVKIDVPNADGTNTVSKTVNGLNIQPDYATNGAFTYRIKTAGDDGTIVEDIITGQINNYDGTVSVASTGGRVTHVQFGGNLSNQNNNHEGAEIDYERTNMEWKIPDGQRINTGLTLERIKDTGALLNINITSRIISDMADVLTQFEDSEIISELDKSFVNWKGKTDLPFGYEDGFTESYEFSATAPPQVIYTDSLWIEKELKFRLQRLIDQLKTKLRTEDIMFVLYGHPNNITLIQNQVNWLINKDTRAGGINLEYSFGVMTDTQDRLHVVSTMKCPVEKGIRVVAYPLSKETYTFKHYKYALNFDNAYKNPYTPLIHNIMATSRWLFTEVLPVQGEMRIINADFGRQPQG